jgi:sugar phosphate isomerase/epimerase
MITASLTHPTNRRSFLKTTSMAVAGSMLGGGAFGRVALADPSAPLGVGQSRSFHGPVGLQLYSLRELLKKKGPLAVLDQAKEWGFKHVEVSDIGKLKPAQYKVELDRRGITPVSKGFPYERLRDDIDGVIAEAEAIGVHFVGTMWITHKDPFDEKQCRAAAAVFNRAGKALAEHGMEFFFHNHGYEFGRYGDGTIFDLLAAETDPKLVGFEMDVCWVVQPKQDPVKLLEKYPHRFQLMHVKDTTGGVSDGDGKVHWAAVLRASQTAGVKCYLIEDESPDPMKQIPCSLRVLEKVEF